MAKAPIGSRKLFVGGVPQDMHQTDLYSIFSEYGKVKKAWVQKCKHVSNDSEAPQNHRGFGFVIFVDESTIEHLLGGNSARFIMLPNGRKLEIKLALSSNKIASDPSVLTQSNQNRATQRILHVATGGAAAAAAAAAAVVASKTVAMPPPPSFGVPTHHLAPNPQALMSLEPLKVKPCSFPGPPRFSDFSRFPADVAALPRFAPPGLAPPSWHQKDLLPPSEAARAFGTLVSSPSAGGDFGSKPSLEDLMEEIRASNPRVPLINAWSTGDTFGDTVGFANNKL